jgi:hypothetical protein
MTFIEAWHVVLTLFPSLVKFIFNGLWTGV